MNWTLQDKFTKEQTTATCYTSTQLYVVQFKKNYITMYFISNHCFNIISHFSELMITLLNSINPAKLLFLSGNLNYFGQTVYAVCRHCRHAGKNVQRNSCKSKVGKISFCGLDFVPEASTQWRKKLPWQCYQDAIVAIYFSFNNFDVSLF